MQNLTVPKHFQITITNLESWNNRIFGFLKIRQRKVIREICTKNLVKRMSNLYDVVCIGAGISGLYTVKYMKEVGLTAVALEKESNIGGVWNYRDTPGGVIESTITTSSKVVTESSDYGFKKTVGDFPTHFEFQEYIQGYADHHNLKDDIKCNVQVTHAEKKDDLWHITDQTGQIWKGKNLVVAAGANTIPNIPSDLAEKFKDFAGKKIHASIYKKPDIEYKGKRILLIGGGESGADIAQELTYQTDHVYISIANGQWFGDRMGGILNRFPLEHFSSRARRFILDGDKTPDLFWILKLYTEYKGGFQGHGIDCWRCPYDSYATSFINKNTAILDRIKQGLATAKPGVHHVEGNTVFFNDNSCAEFDMVMFCTGYQFKTDWIHLPATIKKDFCISKLFKMCIHPDDTSFAFIGYARPVRGSIPSGAEIQAWMYSYFLSGKIKMPSKQEMMLIAEKERIARDKHFNGSNSRIKTLCPIYDYCDDIAKLIGIYPDYFSLLKKVGLNQWLRIVRTPFHMSQYRLNTEEGLKYHLTVVDRFLPNAPPNILVTAVLGRIGYFITSNYKAMVMCVVFYFIIKLLWL